MKSYKDFGHQRQYCRASIFSGKAHCRVCCTLHLPVCFLFPSPNLYLLLLLIENGRLHVQTHERNRPIWNPDISSSICVSLNQGSLERGCSYLCKANLFIGKNFVCGFEKGFSILNWKAVAFSESNVPYHQKCWIVDLMTVCELCLVSEFCRKIQNFWVKKKFLSPSECCVPHKLWYGNMNLGFYCI